MRADCMCGGSCLSSGFKGCIHIIVSCVCDRSKVGNGGHIFC